MSSSYYMNFYLKVNENVESEEEQTFWQKVLVASVNGSNCLEGKENALEQVTGFEEVDVSESSESEDFEDGVVTEFCYRTQMNLTAFYTDFINKVGKAIYRFAKEKNVVCMMRVEVWWEDREPDDVVEQTMEDMAG